jgi:phenylacetate-CoA ligase
MHAEVELSQRFFTTLLKTQWASSHDLREYQEDLLARLYAHARAHSPFYGTYPSLAKTTKAITNWADVPFLSRHDLIVKGADIKAATVPRSHGAVLKVTSGGTTGRPTIIALTPLEMIARITSSYRMSHSWNMDISQPLIMVRKPQYGWGRTDALAFRRWGYPWVPETDLGWRYQLDIHVHPQKQLELISAQAPAHLNTLPSNLLRVGLLAQANSIKPTVPFIMAVAEYLPPEVRRLANEVFGSRIVSILSSAEGGAIAVECPASGMLHIQSELVLAEIIGEDGSPCAAGEIGELVVTPLYNYAAPLIRYRSGDFVEAGPACPCGRSLPTISRVIGRREHMFVFPDGVRSLPAIDRVHITKLLNSETWQFAQVAQRTAEFRYAGAKIGPALWDRIHSHLRQVTEEAFKIMARPGVGLPLTSGGKRHFCVNQMVLDNEDGTSGNVPCTSSSDAWV